MFGPAFRVSFLLFVLVIFFPHTVVASITINEYTPNANPEWVEFYYSGSDLDEIKSYWLDDDIEFDSDLGTAAKKKLDSLNTDNPNYPYLEINSFLNNSGDSVVIFDDAGNLIDSTEYSVDPGLNISIGRSPDQSGGFQVLSSATKGEPNQIEPSSTPTLTSTPTSTPIPTPTPTITSSPTPTSQTSTSLSVSFPPLVKQGESFAVSATLDHAEPNQAYYFKVRLGPSSSSLNHSQTLSGTNWLSDNAAYVEFDSFTTDSSGHLFTNLTARVSADIATESTLKAEVRARLVGGSTNIDSATGSINIEIISTPAPTAKATATVFPTPTLFSANISSSPSSSLTPNLTATTSDVLGAAATLQTTSNRPAASISSSAFPTSSNTNRFTFGKALGLTGIGLLLSALIYLSYQESWYKL